jgi:carbonic anhydrase
MGFTQRLLDTVSEPAFVVDPAALPRRGISVLTCMDPRVDPLAALGLRPGDAHLLRNAGGIVTDDVVESLAISQRMLGTREIVVLHHTGCAGLHERTPRQGGEGTVREAVRAIQAARRIPHRDAVRGVMLDTTTGRVRPVAVPPVRAAAARPAASHPAGSVHAPSDGRRCAWCHRPFAPTGHARWRHPRSYCGDLCRLAARRARGARR